MNIHMYTLGCSVNDALARTLRERLLLQGACIDPASPCDIAILLSCAVTKTAEAGTLRLLQRLRRKHPQARLLLVGCYVVYCQRHGRPLPKEADAHLATIDAIDIPATSAPLAQPTPQTAHILVQNGCDHRCAYCVVPQLRGPSVSVPLEMIEAEVQAVAEGGTREVVLCGMNLGLYRDGAATLADVLARVEAIPGIDAMRLSSLEPGALNAAFLDALPHLSKLAPHLHISLQSGCDKTLAAMGRPYDFAAYRDAIAGLRALRPDMAVTTDVIVGFPGESDADFAESCDNIARCHFSDIHIFKYSQRRGTRASEMPGQLTEHQKGLRARLLEGIRLQARRDHADGLPATRADPTARHS